MDRKLVVGLLLVAVIVLWPMLSLTVCGILSRY